MQPLKFSEAEISTAIQAYYTTSVNSMPLNSKEWQVLNYEAISAIRGEVYRLVTAITADKTDVIVFTYAEKAKEIRQVHIAGSVKSWIRKLGKAYLQAAEALN